MPGIDLTPPQEIKRHKTQHVVGTSIRAAIPLFIFVGVLGGYFFYTSHQITSSLTALDNKEAALTKEREGMSEVEGYAKKLSGKYFLLQKYLASRLKYSSILQELTSRIPTGITLTTIGFDGVGKRARVAGTSTDVVQVSGFVNRLAKDGNASTESSVNLSGKNAFTDVRLESLSVDEGKPVEYAVTFKVNEEVFLK